VNARLKLPNEENLPPTEAQNWEEKKRREKEKAAEDGGTALRASRGLTRGAEGACRSSKGVGEVGEARGGAQDEDDAGRRGNNAKSNGRFQRVCRAAL
jgi:hypothetical protein